ncbi:hypothetical protein PT974_10796 [Cladobotryum mycophilum]|uniref:Gfd2/YDR514C-like C-terminal domain-containing protein n=1 Tax=Cladobotryum mycophilum TaxID=491253 RepID=A0ABR0SBY8_9HYPO
MASTLKPHTGILREENIALRQILGYRLESLQSSPYSPPQIGQYLSGTSIKDVLLVAVDVDTGEVMRLSRLTRVSILASQFLTLGALDTRPCKWAAKSFLFGETELISLCDIPTRFSLLTQDRNYVIVAHGTREDIKFFNNIDPEIINRASYILDTVKAAQFPLQLYYRYSIEKLLDEFDIRYAKLHAAGNDAHFALKALLMIAVRDGRMAPYVTTSSNEDMFRLLDAIAHAPCALPVWTETPPVTCTSPEKNKKLGIYAKRRLRAERKAVKRAFKELPCSDESTG